MGLEGIEGLADVFNRLEFWALVGVVAVVVAVAWWKVTELKTGLQSRIIGSFEGVADDYRASSDKNIEKAGCLEERVFKLELSNDELKDTVQSQEDRIDSLTKQIRTRNKRILDLERKIAEMQTEIDARDERIIELEQQVKQLIEEREELRKRLSETV